MAITDLVPWRKTNQNLAVRRQERDPFVQLRQNIDEMFDRFLGDWSGGMNLLDRPFGTIGRFMPEIDVTETSKEIRLTADLPGMARSRPSGGFIDEKDWSDRTPATANGLRHGAKPRGRAAEAVSGSGRMADPGWSRTAASE